MEMISTIWDWTVVLIRGLMDSGKFYPKSFLFLRASHRYPTRVYVGLSLLHNVEFQLMYTTMLPAPPSFKIAFVVEPSTVMLDERRDKESSNLLRGRVLKNLRLTQESHFQDIRHLEIEITKPETLSLSDTKITYNSGDALALRPHNTASRVNDFLELMNWQEVADRPLNIEPTRTDTKIPSHLSTYSASQLTLRTLLTHHLDIHGRPRRYFFQLLSFFATSEQHTERLIELASTEGQDDLYKYCHLLKRTVFEVLQDFPCRIPLSYLFDLFPGMRPRSFSIASSNSLHPFQIHLTVGIVEFKTKMQAPRLGVCTHWMRQWQAGREPFRFASVKHYS